MVYLLLLLLNGIGYRPLTIMQMSYCL